MQSFASSGKGLPSGSSRAMIQAGRLLKLCDVITHKRDDDGDEVFAVVAGATDLTN